MKASSARVSGSASGSYKVGREVIEKDSKIRVLAFGGSVEVDPTSIDKAKDSYPIWAKGVKEGKVAFVDSKQAIPIWEIIAAMDKKGASEKANAIEAYFNSRSDEISKDFKNSIGVTPYISEIKVAAAGSKEKAKDLLRQQGILEEHIVNLDLSKGAGGNYVFMGYKTSTNKAEAITGLCADYFSKKQNSNITYNDKKYTIIATDINSGAGKKYIYLYYTKDVNAGAPITGIQYQDNSTYEKGNANGYEVVRCASNDKAMDFNKSVGGHDVHLWFTRK